MRTVLLCSCLSICMMATFIGPTSPLDIKKMRPSLCFWNNPQLQHQKCNSNNCSRNNSHQNHCQFNSISSARLWEHSNHSNSKHHQCFDLILILVLVYIKRDFFAAFIRERINTVGKNHQVEDKQLTSVKLLQHFCSNAIKINEKQTSRSLIN